MHSVTRQRVLVTTQTSNAVSQGLKHALFWNWNTLTKLIRFFKTKLPLNTNKALRINGRAIYILCITISCLHLLFKFQFHYVSLSSLFNNLSDLGETLSEREQLVILKSKRRCLSYRRGGLTFLLRCLCG